MLCHGDLKVSNMLFKRLSDGTPYNEVLAVLDWQATFYGEPLLHLYVRYAAV
jgi:aminoglycoside phosphotransferase (APT) family kinase protein